MPLRFTHRILEHLAHSNYEPSTPDALVHDMGIAGEERPAFDEAIRKLAADRQIELGKDGLVRLPRYGDEMTGRFKLNPRGFGFIIPDHATREGDLFVPAGNTRDALSGDRVRAAVIRQAGRGRRESGRSEAVGRILEVVERGQEHYVGTLVHRSGNWFVDPDGRSLNNPVLIRDPHSKSPQGAQAGSKVVFELTKYPEGDFVAEGVITQVLGEAGRPDVETQAVIVAHGLRTEFTPQIVDQARGASRTFDRESAGPWPDREDLSGAFIFTIDPPDAKDFDDAISISHDEASDRWTLGVHIADVSSFVRMGTGLDEEARIRGNSVYLPRLVLPMLPEVLSNGVCSLQEGVPRFTKSAFVTFDGRGHVIGQRLAATVIKSAKRLTYLEAQALIDGDHTTARQHARTDSPYTNELIDTLRLCDKLAHILNDRRHRDGMIVLNLPEVELIFDEHGHVTDAVPEDDSFTHKLIEMFMVEANEAVARVFSSLNIPVLRRIHPEPVHGDIEQLRMYARAARVDVPEKPTRKDLQRLLDATRNTPASRAIHFAVLRTLAKATYSPAMVGHFALASEHYAHFTSPIRRYPDLTLHRTVAAYLDATGNGRKLPGDKKRRELTNRLAADDRVLDEGELIELGRHCSETEVEAEQAERELRDFLVMQFLQEKHLGDEFPGVITGVSGGGVFVSIERFLVEGMVKMQDLPMGSGRKSGGGGGGGGGGRADRWLVNERTGRLTAPRGGMSIGIGDIITVQIAKVNLAARRLDLLITKLPERAQGAAPDAEHVSAGGHRKPEARHKPGFKPKHGKHAVGSNQGSKKRRDKRSKRGRR